MNLKECKRTIKVIREASKKKDDIIHDLKERLEYQDRFAGELVAVLNEYVPFKHWPKEQCPVCQEPIDFQKDHSVYHPACQKRAASARYRAKSKQVETLQEDAIETIILMLKLLEGEQIDIHLAFSSIVEISKVLRSPDQDDAIYTLQPAEAEFLEAIRKYESDANPRRSA